MSKNASLAHGEAMPSLNRRRMLMGLAAASAAAGVVALQTEPAHGEGLAKLSKAPEENPALIRLADDLSAVAAEFDAALVRLRTARAVADAIWPVAEGGVVAEGLEPGWDYERDVAGNAIERPGDTQARRIIKVNLLASSLANLDLALTKRRGKDLVSVQGMRAKTAERLAQVQAYEARMEAARKSSGYVDARARYDAAEGALIATVRNVMAEPAKSLTGVVIKAEALQAWVKVPLLPRTLATLKDDWTAGFASELLAIASA